MVLTVNDIREAFLAFFEGKGHTRLSSSSLVPHNDPTLMFTNAGMNQFKHVFSGVETVQDKQGGAVVRATTSQKCVRAGGKHNDLENVGYTARHLTFFEMLGNFSFGDYFKQDAIAYAWEFVTEVLKLPAERLYVTVYHTDDEAFALWKETTGFPDGKILRVPTKDNFWEMGDTGPCGPCSEIFYDHGDAIEGEWALDEEGYDLFGERYVEIWNLVFMQHEKHPDGRQTDLPKPCIDTGMGLERISTVLQGKHTVYDVDLFQQLISASQDISGNADPALLSSHRIIADHLRSCCFLLADGVMPSNEGRGYVLRRIMRRAMRHAHILGCGQPLMYRLVPALLQVMGQHYTELNRAEALITETLKLEEERFRETLERGLRLLDEASDGLQPGDKLDGEVAFKLYDTYGFPLDLTEDILRSREITIDHAGFDAAMAEQKARARAAHKGSGDAATSEIWFDIHEQHGATEFLGYDLEVADGKIVALVKDGQQVQQAAAGDEVMILTNQTPFYGESGGQAGDQGKMTQQDARVTVTDTRKELGALHTHIATIDQGSIAVGDIVHMEVDGARRQALRANHSCTHLLHKVLRDVLGAHVTQKGSLVEAAYFRFDFNNPKGLSPEEKQQVQAQVNSIINQKQDVTTKLMTPDEAIEAGAMALFGEKYGDEVRVVSMGSQGGGVAFSVELCGGTHVRNIGDIGQFVLTSEGSVASGIRRIEGMTGQRAQAFLQDQAQKQQEQQQRQQAAEQARAEQAKAASGAREQFRATIPSATEIGGVSFLGQVMEGLPAKDLRSLVDDFKQAVDNGIVVIVAVNDGKASLVVGVTDTAQATYNAVDLVRAGSGVLGGKGGGGRPDFAQAGGPDGDKADAAIDAIRKMVG